METYNREIFTLCIHDKYVGIHSKNLNKFLLIERNPYRVFFKYDVEMKNFNFTKIKSIHAFLGVIRLDNSNYMAYSTKSKKVANLNNHDIFELEELDFLSLTEDTGFHDETLEIIKKYLQTGFYYSFTLNLTNSKPFPTNRVKFAEYADKRFFWNFQFFEDIMVSGAENNFATILINGYIEEREIELRIINKKAKYLLLSRRSVDYNFNGIYQIETEQYVQYDNHIFSFSILKTDGIFEQRFIENEATCSNLINEIFFNKKYDYPFYLSIINLKNNDELIFSTIVKEELINYGNIENYIQLTVNGKEVNDPFEEFKKNYLDSTNKLYDVTKDYLNNKKIINLISFDNLEIREKVFKEISLCILKQILSFMHKEPKYVLSKQNEMVKISEDWAKRTSEIEITLNNFKDILELQYRTNFFEMKKDNYIETFNDSEIFSLFNKPKKKEKNYGEITLLVATWNFAGEHPSDTLDIDKWLNININETTPDIFVIGLQEIVVLNAKNVLFHDNSNSVLKWKQIISKKIAEIDQYKFVNSENLVGLYMIIFAKVSILDKLKNFSMKKKNTGFSGAFGNKGNIYMTFLLNQTSFAFCCTHLQHSINNNVEREKGMLKILGTKLDFQGRKDSKKFKDFDIQVIFGDLNFRIDLEYDACKKVIDVGDLEILSKFDQYNQLRANNKEFEQYIEGPLFFKPTYKFDKNSTNYDTSKKRRVPAWCDRVIYRESPRITLINYDSVDYHYSDHLPVYSTFKINYDDDQCMHRKALKRPSNMNMSFDNILSKTSTTKSKKTTSKMIDFDLIDENDDNDNQYL